MSRGPSSGQEIVAEKGFNARGGVDWSDEPRYTGDTERTTHYEYDALGRVTRVTMPGNREVTTSYAATSVTTTDPDGKTTTTRTDGFGRTTSVERPFGASTATTSTTYDRLGRRVGMTDPIGASWSWTYDSLGRMTAQNDPDAGNWTYAYDDAGRLTSQTDAKSQTTTLTYDTQVGRLATRQNAAGTVTYTYSQARGSYSNTGRLTTVTSPADTLQTDYDALGRVVKQDRLIDATHYVVTKTYDAASLVSIVYPDGDTVGPMQYDGAGRVSSVSGILTSVSYDAVGRPLTQSNGNGTTTNWTYGDTRGFLTRIQTTGGGGTIQDLQYTQYTDAGLLQQVTSPIAGEGWSYAYDDLNHLTTATNLTNGADTQTYSYDAGDRIMSSSRYGIYVYPGTGSARPHGPTSVGGTAITYDLNGNTLTAGTRGLTWNADNRLSQTTLGGVTATYSYGGDGDRVKKTSSLGTSTYPFGDDYEITGGVTTKYIPVAGLGVVAKRVGTGGSAVTYWLHTDRLGSIQAVTNTPGTAVFRRQYRPYGETLAQTGSHTESRGWIDQRIDAESALTYLHARYLDPQLGVFVSPDPLGADGGTNLYAYGRGDAVNGSDRSGLLKDPCYEGSEYDPGCPAPSLSPALRMGMNEFMNVMMSPGAGIVPPALAALESEFENRLAQAGHGGPYVIYSNGLPVGVTLDPVTANRNMCIADTASCRGRALQNDYVSVNTGVVLGVSTQDVRQQYAMNPTASVVGKIFNAPNSAVGVAGAILLNTPKTTVSVSNNAIVLTNMRLPGTAQGITLGNFIFLSGDSNPSTLAWTCPGLVDTLALERIGVPHAEVARAVHAGVPAADGRVGAFGPYA